MNFLAWICIRTIQAILLVPFFLFGFPDPVAAFPDTIRLGYRSCSTCHVSPTGGGLLKPYGRSAGEELATWAPEGSGRLLGVVPEVPGVLVGGDARYAVVTHANDTTTEEVNYQLEHNVKAFPMQVEGEVALNPDGGVWVVGTLGHYGDQLDRQLRRSYALWTFNEESQVFQGSLRAGRFIPAYGINTPDHTAATRQGIGLGQGSERLVAEANVETPVAQITISETFDGQGGGYLNEESGYSLYAGRPGWAARIAGHAIGSTIGVSGWRRSVDTVVGAYAAIPLTRELYVLTETDRATTRETGLYRDVSWTELGWEVVRGLTVLGTGEYEGSGRYGGGLRWIPVPHLELVGRGKWQAGVWSAMIMSHLWL